MIEWPELTRQMQCPPSYKFLSPEDCYMKCCQLPVEEEEAVRSNAVKNITRTSEWCILVWRCR